MVDDNPTTDDARVITDMKIAINPYSEGLKYLVSKGTVKKDNKDPKAITDE